MLTGLLIENIAVIEKTEIEFSDGLNILTGETGAGKSIVIDSINAVMGMRTSRELIRTGAKTAKVVASFCGISPSSMQKLAELGYEPDGDELLIMREISDSRNTCRINGIPANTAILKELGQELINIHGQHENQALLDPERHIEYLDALGDYESLFKEYADSFDEMSKIKDKLSEQVTDEHEKARKIELLRYQIDELSNAEIKTGEQAQLTQRLEQFQNREFIRSSIYTSNQALYGDEDSQGALSLLKTAVNSYTDAAEYLDGGAQELLSSLQENLYNLEDYASQISSLLDISEDNDEDINSIEERLDLLYRLSRKYGSDEDEMLEFLSSAQNELEDIELSDERVEELEALLEVSSAKTSALAKKLSDKRQKCALSLAKTVRDELSFLDMPNLVFEVSFTPKKLSGNGSDTVEFLISANVGEAPKPISKIASGGELSRIMLAIKNVLADKDGTDTLIFDEIDTGMSGLAAQKVGQKLKQVSKSRQVICVTHLAQIAAFADSHLYISKNVRDNRTFTEVEILSEEKRALELAHMSSGANITETAIKNAKEMLEFSKDK